MAFANSMSGSWSISADWVVPVSSPAIRNGVVRMRDGLIEAVGPAGEIPPAEYHEALGSVAVLPGFINAHCHLELTDLRGRLPSRRPMPQWLFALIMQHRRGIDFAGGARRGAAELLASGCTAVGDVCHDNAVWPALVDSPLWKVCYAEVTGIGPKVDGAIDRLVASLAGCVDDPDPTGKLRFGVSPHAPYSTDESVYRQAIELAQSRDLPVSTHLAETIDEAAFLKDCSGPLFEFLARLGLINQSVRAPGLTPVGYAASLGLLEMATVLAHVHYVTDAELDLLAGGRAHVAYCPRSTAFFGRSGHRYAEMLDRGVNVCLGTDSLASNASLDMLAEMRTIWADGRVSAETVIRMATLNGARALGLADRIGALAAGLAADWVALPCPGDCSDPSEAVLAIAEPAGRVVIAGRDVTKQ